MDFLPDTNTWSLLYRRDPNVTARIQGLAEGDRVFMSVVCFAEIQAGIRMLPDSNRRSELQSFLNELLDRNHGLLGIDKATGDRYASVLAELKAAGTPIGSNDIWIAATALNANCTVVSSDQDLTRVRGLQVVDWKSMTVPGRYGLHCYRSKRAARPDTV